MPSLSPDYSDPDANPLPVLAATTVGGVLCWLVTSSIEHAILLWGGVGALAGFLVHAYAFIDVTLHPYYGPHEAPAARQKRRAAERAKVWRG